MNLHPIFVAAFSDELQKLAAGGGRLMSGVLERVMPQLGGATKAMSTGARRAAGALPAPAHRLSRGAQRAIQTGRTPIRAAPAQSAFQSPLGHLVGQAA